ncbi:MAG: ADP-ribose pyrophosphatase, partial [Marinirhabdus sp.]|nr:ADP-ribose pyrophosphatase [Marinirhabdus sp.]
MKGIGMKVVVEKSRLIFDDFFKIEEAYLRFQHFDGQMSPIVRRLNFERGDSVAALVLNTDTRQVLLVDQFKYPAYKKDGGWLVETVAGTREKDENSG